jgi:hypothetical protein
MADLDKSKVVLENAQRLFERYYVSCFWHMKPDLVVTDAMLPAIIKGLRMHGGRAAFLEADRLEKDSRSCR